MTCPLYTRDVKLGQSHLGQCEVLGHGVELVWRCGMHALEQI